MWTRIENCRVHALDQEFILDSNGMVLIPIENVRVRVNDNYELDPNGELVTDFLNARVETGDDYVWDMGGMGGSNPVYKKPIFTIFAAPVTGEVGATTNIAVTTTWSQNDAGAVNGFKLMLTGQPTLTSNSIVSPYAFMSVLLTDSILTLTGSISHAAGPLRNDSEGNPYPAGAIDANPDLASNIINITGFRKSFSITSTTQITVPTTSAEIRAWTSSTAAASSSFKISIPVNTLDIAFACPASLGNNITVYARSFGGIDYASAFVRSAVNVEGANGSAAIPYNIWYCHNDDGMPVADEYTITIT